MAVQPTATPAPSEDELNRALLEALSEPPAGEASLSNATIAINGAGATYPYNTAFDPTSHFDISFNPNSLEDGGAWDAFDVAQTGNGNGIGGIDWNAFINEDDFA